MIEKQTSAMGAQRRTIRETSYWRCSLNWTWKSGDGFDIIVLIRTQGEPTGGFALDGPKVT